MSETVVKARMTNLHRLDCVVSLVNGVDLYIFDCVWEEELVYDVDLVLFECSDGFERVHGEALPRGYQLRPNSPEKESPVCEITCKRDVRDAGPYNNGRAPHPLPHHES